MTDRPVFVDLGDPDALKPAPRRGRKKDEGAEKPPKDVAKLIPVLPPPSNALTKAEVHAGVSQRDRAIVNMKLAGASFVEIADTLEIEDVADVKRAFDRTIALTHAPEDYETLRMTAAARLEMLMKRSIAMAQADFLVDQATGEHIPNEDRRGWHAQAVNDVMMHAALTGAKAPTRVEITPDEARMDELTAQLVRKLGGEDMILDAEVIELDEIPDVPDDVAREPEDLG